MATKKWTHHSGWGLPNEDQPRVVQASENSGFLPVKASKVVNEADGRWPNSLRSVPAIAPYATGEVLVQIGE
jgi:hypothetical protein